MSRKTNKKVNLRKYQKLCKNTAKSFKDKDKEISDWGLGVAGEAGDLAGCIKKTIYHGNDQRGGIRENIGDTMWYLAMICNSFGWQLEEILAENIEKLKKRYPKGFNKKHASRGGTRIDWNEK
jgi:NTP pyrophosphatase (non-canonical NTP hydrolase)